MTYRLGMQSIHLDRCRSLPKGTGLPGFRDPTPMLSIKGVVVVITPLAVATPRRRLGRPLPNLLPQADDITGRSASC
ncbi:MAG: hypothetical protein JWP04_3017 [Belnapia sp.]|nr:hypothetical protein [Belnapia sp.]